MCGTVFSTECYSRGQWTIGLELMVVLVDALYSSVFSLGLHSTRDMVVFAAGSSIIIVGQCNSWYEQEFIITKRSLNDSSILYNILNW